MPRGIRAMNEWSFEGTLGQKNDPHTNPAGSMFTAYPLTPNSTTSSASNPGKFDAKPTGRSLDHIAAGAVNKTTNGMPLSATNPGAAPSSCRSAACRAAPRTTMNVISWSDDKGTIFPGLGLADDGLQQPHEPLRHGPDEPGHLQGGPRQERHRLRARRPEPALQHQHERGRTSRSSPRGPSSSTTRAARSAAAPQCTQATATNARPDRDHDRQRHHEDRRTSSWISRCSRRSATPTA